MTSSRTISPRRCWSLSTRSEQNCLLAAMGELSGRLKPHRWSFAAEAPDSPDARLCLTAYFRELAARFEGGFNAGADDLCSMWSTWRLRPVFL